ncbi:MAG: pyridoxamine 5'-phosphate oxidase family protein [Deltaproteobacteria bacterium]|nr:pyridoxamine 5'-phosphate oxidase family protein [Deltaproteobacteria bacterium]
MNRKKDSTHLPSDEELRGLTLSLIAQQKTMTLATAKGGAAWAAPVYYVFSNSSFYFFSAPDSRHIQESSQSHQASAAIHAAARTWREIQGIQMAGLIQPVPPGPQAIQVFGAYLKRFHLTKEFFEGGASFDLESFALRFRVKLYKFKPTEVYYLDNQIHFGFRGRILNW